MPYLCDIMNMDFNDYKVKCLEGGYVNRITKFGTKKVLINIEDDMLKWEKYYVILSKIKSIKVGRQYKRFQLNSHLNYLWIKICTNTKHVKFSFNSISSRNFWLKAITLYLKKYHNIVIKSTQVFNEALLISEDSDIKTLRIEYIKDSNNNENNNDNDKIDQRLSLIKGFNSEDSHSSTMSLPIEYQPTIIIDNNQKGSYNELAKPVFKNSYKVTPTKSMIQSKQMDYHGYNGSKDIISMFMINILKNGANMRIHSNDQNYLSRIRINDEGNKIISDDDTIEIPFCKITGIGCGGFEMYKNVNPLSSFMIEYEYSNEKMEILFEIVNTNDNVDLLPTRNWWIQSIVTMVSNYKPINNGTIESLQRLLIHSSKNDSDFIRFNQPNITINTQTPIVTPSLNTMETNMDFFTPKEFGCPNNKNSHKNRQWSQSENMHIKSQKNANKYHSFTDEMEYHRHNDKRITFIKDKLIEMEQLQDDQTKIIEQLSRDKTIIQSNYKNAEQKLQNIIKQLKHENEVLKDRLKLKESTVNKKTQKGYVEMIKNLTVELDMKDIAHNQLQKKYKKSEKMVHNLKLKLNKYETKNEKLIQLIHQRNQKQQMSRLTNYDNNDVLIERYQRKYVQEKQMNLIANCENEVLMTENSLLKNNLENLK